MNRNLQYFLIALAVLVMLGGLLALVSSDRFSWQVESLQARVKYALDPPQAAAFIPQKTAATAAPAAAGAAGATTTLAPTPTIALTPPTPAPAAPTGTATPTLAPTPLPGQAQLSGITHMYQMTNNCAPANLAMALTYWGWKGDQRDTAAVLKPNKQDKNVMPYEMESYIENETNLEAVVRVGGDLTSLKAFVASGYPVIVERGYEGANFDGWMGHYQVVSGFDDAASAFTVQDSYTGPDQLIPYDDLYTAWRAFNYTYLVIYPPDKRQQVLDILGLNAYENYNYRSAESRAVQEAPGLTGRDLFFALFNQGSNLVAVQEYTAAAGAYDSAFANYEQLSPDQRPWRAMWYQTGPYFAYYYTERYDDVVKLATQTLDAMSDPVLEESFFWRARALLGLGQEEAAIKDFQECVTVHEGFAPCVQELDKLGIEITPQP